MGRKARGGAGSVTPGSAHMWHMSEPSAVKAAFAPVWPRVYKAPTAGQIIPPYGRARVFNRDLTVEELGPLTEDFPVPGRTLRLIGGYAFMGAGCVTLALWTIMLIMAVLVDGIDFSETEEQGISAFIQATFDFVASLTGWVILAAIAVGLVGIVIDIVAWKKWGASLTAAWGRYEGRLVRTGVPGKRQPMVHRLCRRADAALKQMDAHSAGPRLLGSTARAAIGRFIDLPVPSKSSRRVARSAVDDVLVQKIRNEYEAAKAAETAALQEAEDAVVALEVYVSDAKAAAAEQEIIKLAKTIVIGSAS